MKIYTPKIPDFSGESGKKEEKMRKLSAGIFSVFMSGIISGSVMAGNLDDPGDPSAGSGMYTLQSLYDYLISGTVPTIPGSFQEPSAGPGSTMKTTKQIYDDIKAIFDASPAAPGQVRDTTTFFSTDTDNWGQKSGTIQTRTLVDTSTTVDAGYYNATTLTAVDSDLAPGNVRSGVTVFGINGDPNVVNTSSGDAVEGELLNGKKAWVGGSEVTGTMTNVGQQTIIPTTTNQAITQGYHNGTGSAEGDADLVSGNIRQSMSIFGVSGDPNVANTSSGNATAGEILDTKVAWVDGSEVSGSILTRTLLAGNTTVSEGFYNATTLDAVDSDLAPANIKSGMTIFGVGGDVNVVDTSSGDATAIDIRTGKIAYVDGSQVTGTGGGELLKTGQTTSYRANDDGALQKGVAFSYQTLDIGGDVVTIDNATGLMWPEDGTGDGGMWGLQTEWSRAIDYCNSLSFASQTDWRLPNGRELHSICNLETGNVTSSAYFSNLSGWKWLSTTYTPSGMAYCVNFSGGSLYKDNKIVQHGVLAVRGPD